MNYFDMQIKKNTVLG